MSQKTGLSLFWRIVLTLALVLFYNQILSLIPFPVLGKILKNAPMSFGARMYPSMFGITPFISACFLVTVIYYILGGSESRHVWLSNRGFMWKMVLGGTLFFILFSSYFSLSWAYSRFDHGEMNYFPKLLADLLLVPVFVFIGVYLAYQITRLGVVDGVWALIVLNLRTWTYGGEYIVAAYGRFLEKTPDPNSRLGTILTVLFIVAVVVVLAARYIKRSYFEFSLRTKSGATIHIPIYVAGLFFFLIGTSIAGIVLSLPFMFIHRPTLFVSNTLDVFNFLTHFIPPFIGYFLYVYSAGWIFKKTSLKENPVLIAADENTIRRAFLRWGRIYFIGYFVCRAGGYAGIQFFNLFNLSYFYEILFLILIFVLEWQNQWRILSGDYTPVLQTDSVRVSLEGQIALADADIKVVPHQNAYNFFAGFTVPFLGDKTLYVPEADAPRAQKILEEVFKESK
ncbi:MAG: hypothetical protein NT106_08850 [Candidatus Sumerlaeota bacterium]|nr:hypothetical protein [Candidatus Sumerlaeota bacterium]